MNVGNNYRFGIKETSAWQRCRPFVLRDGDPNTSFFHAKASNWKRRNKISKLKDANGVMRDEKEKIEEIVNYFQEIFLSTSSTICEQDVAMIETVISKEMCDKLRTEFSREEVLMALKDIHPCKSPDHDGMPALFYQQFWDLAGDEVCSLVLDVLRGG